MAIINHGGTAAVTAGGVGVAKMAAVVANGHAHAIVSEGLYGHSAYSKGREQMCNADDIHKQVGQDKQFEVWLPTDLKPEFVVKDYGTGLTEDEFANVYCALFSSTKSGNNNLTGGFGLGAQTWRLDGDNAIVRSCVQGSITVYNLFVDETGASMYRVLAKDEPDAENWGSGIEVQMPIEPNKISDYQRNLKQVLAWFNPKPEVFGGEIDDNTAYLDELRLRGFNNDCPDTPYHADWHVKQGPAAYPVDFGKAFDVQNFRMFWSKRDLASYAKPDSEQFIRVKKAIESAGYKFSNLNEALMFASVLQTSVSRGVVEVPMGAVVPLPSREALRYNAFTNASLVKVLFQAGTNYGLELLECFEDEAIDLTNEIQVVRAFSSNSKLLTNERGSAAVVARFALLFAGEILNNGLDMLFEEATDEFMTRLHSLRVFSEDAQVVKSLAKILENYDHVSNYVTFDAVKLKEVLEDSYDDILDGSVTLSLLQYEWISRAGAYKPKRYVLNLDSQESGKNKLSMSLRTSSSVVLEDRPEANYRLAAEFNKIAESHDRYQNSNTATIRLMVKAKKADIKKAEEIANKLANFLGQECAEKLSEKVVAADGSSGASASAVPAPRVKYARWENVSVRRLNWSRYANSRGFYTAQKLRDIIEDDSESIVWMKVNRNEIFDKEGESVCEIDSYYNSDRLAEVLRTLGWINGNNEVTSRFEAVYAVPETHVDRLPASAVNLFDLFEAKKQAIAKEAAQVQEDVNRNMGLHHLLYTLRKGFAVKDLSSKETAELFTKNDWLLKRFDIDLKISEIFEEIQKIEAMLSSKDKVSVREATNKAVMAWPDEIIDFVELNELLTKADDKFDKYSKLFKRESHGQVEEIANYYAQIIRLIDLDEKEEKAKAKQQAVQLKAASKVVVVDSRQLNIFSIISEENPACDESSEESKAA